MLKEPATLRAGRVAVVLIVSVLVSAACGQRVPSPSTSGVPGTGGSAPNGGGALSLPSVSASTGGGGGIPATGGGGTVGGAAGGGATTGGGTTSPGTGGSTGGGPSRASAPGITPTTIYLGARYLKNQGAANAAVGAAGAGGGDGRSAYRAVIAEINKRGGIAGRKVVPIFSPIDVTSSTPVDQQEQANCATWTQDNKVFAIFAGGNSIYEQCAQKAGAVELHSDVTTGATLPETYRQYPNYVEIAAMNIVRMGSVTVNGLSTQGYFDKGAKIGMLTWDEPVYREGLQRGYLPALARHGLRLATTPVYLTPPQTVQDLGATSAQVNSAVLKFQSAGIDHVMMLDGAAGLCGVGCIGFEFMQRAKAQHYYPRYGFNDGNAPAAGQSAGFYPADELSHSVAVGWDDLDKSYDTGWHVNAARERCYALMRKHGVDLSSVNAQGAALEACDELSFLQAVVSRIGSAPLTPDNVIAAVNMLGSSFASTAVYGTSFSATQHDGIATVRNYHFVDTCTCFRYTSTPYRP